ncbi:MAG TPA: hypothetical protein VN541_18940 [Tepidisphaeraceae bacterium]|nr:hypothetical protein [Tepidisphaeraceae bacterium]
MRDLKSPVLIYLKGILFLITGLLGAAILLVQNPTLKTALVIVVTVWCFARLYYFMFYVIEHYVDPAYRFAGIGSFLIYVCSRSRRGSADADGGVDSPGDR